MKRKYEIWDVVLVPAFPNQENVREVTARPAIIIEDLENEVTLCPVTSQIHQKSRYRYTIQIVQNSPEARLMGLEMDSLIILDRTVELQKIRLVKRIGVCPDHISEQIERLLEQKKKDGN